MKRISILLLLGLFTLPAGAEELVQEFSGTGNTTTAVFRVQSPWLLDWRLNGDYDQMLALDVMLVDAQTGRVVGRVVQSKVRSDGLRLFRQSGSFRLNISSTLARWNIRIEQLTDEEAKQYTPRESQRPASPFGP
jgi:hypothetical protein